MGKLARTEATRICLVPTYINSRDGSLEMKKFYEHLTCLLYGIQFISIAVTGLALFVGVIILMVTYPLLFFTVCLPIFVYCIGRELYHIDNINE